MYPKLTVVYAYPHYPSSSPHLNYTSTEKITMTYTMCCVIGLGI